MIKGQCQCGAVKFRYDGELEETIVCHCKDCQRAHGTAFAFNSPIDERLFVFESGKDALKEFFSSPKKSRVFCQHCGTPLYSYRTDLPNVMRLRMGIIREGHIPAPAKQVHVESKLPYVTVQTVADQ